MASKIDMDFEGLASGHRACGGCGAAIAMRLILKGTGKNTIVANSTGCVEVFTTPYPECAWEVPYVHSLFENAAAVAAGIEAGLKALGKKEGVNVVAIAGDGGTADIGLQSLSGMLERGHDVLYIMYDNEAYMNTGIQRSASTPYGASTTTSPAGKVSIGQETRKKFVAEIAAAHHIPYVATASVGYPRDLINKVNKAVNIKGPKFIQVHAPCVPGWNYPESETIEIARLAVETGLWPLFEMENGVITSVRKIKKKKPVEEYLKKQRRFAHLFKDERGRKVIEEIQKLADENIKRYGLMD